EPLTVQAELARIGAELAGRYGLPERNPPTSRPRPREGPVHRHVTREVPVADPHTGQRRHCLPARPAAGTRLARPDAREPIPSLRRKRRSAGPAEFSGSALGTAGAASYRRVNATSASIASAVPIYGLEVLCQPGASGPAWADSRHAGRCWRMGAPRGAG